MDSRGNDFSDYARSLVVFRHRRLEAFSEGFCSAFSLFPWRVVVQ